MGAPQGNKNAVGHSGGKKGRSGRKSAYQEQSDAQLMWDIWHGKFSLAELEDMITSGKFGAKHTFAALAMKGEIKVLNKLVDKLYSNKQAIDLNTMPELDELSKYSKELNKLISNAKDKTAKTKDTVRKSQTDEPVSV